MTADDLTTAVGPELRELADRVLAIETGHPVRVGLDGPSAAGKSTLADRLAGALRSRTGRVVIRAELDHFMAMVADPDAWPYDSPRNFYSAARDDRAVRDLLLVPLGPGGDRRYRTAPAQPYAWAPRDAILVADGVFLQRPELDDLWDLRIYVDAGEAESRRRAVERDRHWRGSAAEAEKRYLGTYLPAERRYVAAVRPRERADVVIDATDPARPRRLR
jgi:uridine kinase